MALEPPTRRLQDLAASTPPLHSLGPAALATVLSVILEGLQVLETHRLH